MVRVDVEDGDRLPGPAAQGGGGNSGMVQVAEPAVHC